MPIPTNPPQSPHTPQTPPSDKKGPTLSVGPGPMPSGKEKDYETTFTILPDEQFHKDITAVMDKHGLIHPKSFHFILSKSGDNLYLVDHYKLAPGERPVQAAMDSDGQVIADQYENEQVNMNVDKAPPGVETEDLQGMDSSSKPRTQSNEPRFTRGGTGGRFSVS